MANATTSIEHKLKQAWREERRFVHLRGASRFVIWLIAMIVMDLLIDWGIVLRTHLTGNLGVLLLVTNGVVLTWVLWREWLRHLKPYDPLRVALEVEGRHPELSSLLVSYTQLNGLKTNQPNVSDELIDAMCDQAITRTRPLDFREIVDFGQLKLLFVVVAGVLLFFGAISMSWPKDLSKLFQRLVGANITYTQIVKLSDDITVRVGGSAEVTAEADGFIPDEGRLYIRPADGAEGWKTLPLSKDRDQPVYARQLKELTRDLEFYVRIGDAQTAPRRIRVVQAPAIVAVDVKLHYPSYVNREPGQSDQLDLDVPEGTDIEWHLTCKQPVKQLKVRMGDKTIDAQIDATGKHVAFGEADVRQALKYTFQWTVEESGKVFHYDDVQHSIRVAADSIPEIELVYPNSNGLATVKKTVKMLASANDDHGLSEAWLVYSVGDKPPRPTRIQDFSGAPSQEFSYTWVPSQDIKDLEPGMEITFHVVVADSHPAARQYIEELVNDLQAGKEITAPFEFASSHPEAQNHIRHSARRKLRIVEPETYLQWYRGELAAQHDEIKRARTAEQISSAKVKQIKNQEGLDE